MSRLVKWFLLLASFPVVHASTWYVRPDGGTRFSTNQTTGGCDGQGDAAYVSGINQHCAFNDVRFLWQDGSNATDTTHFPAWGWVIAGGDTVIIRGSLGTSVTYRVGWPNASSSLDSGTGLHFGVTGDPFNSGPPPPPSGTSGTPTRILGENFAACHTTAAKTQIHGGFAIDQIFDLRGASYVTLQCLDLTDFSSCGRAGQTSACNTTIGSLSDFAGTAIKSSNASTHLTLTDLNIHGLGAAGMIGATGTGAAFDYIAWTGNAGSGWNADSGDGTTGTGTLSVTHYAISWNGCAEEYPIVDSLPYQDCADDNNAGGYGDGFGTASVASSPGWTINFDQGTVSYNTQDGFDALHVTGSGSNVKVTRTLAFGNMGQQIKVGGTGGDVENNLLVNNCNALRSAIPGTPSGYNSRLTDFCRAADTGVALSVSGANTLIYRFNTMYSAASVGVQIGCESGATCDSTTKVDFRDNVFLGFLNNTTNGYPGGGTGDYSDPMYDGLAASSIDVFANTGSFLDHNLTFHGKSTWNCPNTSYTPGGTQPGHETNALCVAPGLVDETWHNYGTGNMQIAAAESNVYHSGVTISGVTLDYAGNTRNSPPSIGAYDPFAGGIRPPTHLTGTVHITNVVIF